MRPPASKIKRKPNDGYEPLTFRQDDVKKMAPKEQGEDLLRILIAGLQRKLNLPQATTHPQAARPRKNVSEQSVQPAPPSPTRSSSRNLQVPFGDGDHLRRIAGRALVLFGFTHSALALTEDRATLHQDDGPHPLSGERHRGLRAVLPRHPWGGEIRPISAA